MDTEVNHILSFMEIERAINSAWICCPAVDCRFPFFG